MKFIPYELSSNFALWLKRIRGNTNNFAATCRAFHEVFVPIHGRCAPEHTREVRLSSDRIDTLSPAVRLWWGALKLPDRVNQTQLVRVAAVCPRATAVHIYWGTDITDDSLEALTLLCPAIVKLRLTWCPHITYRGLEFLKHLREIDVGCSSIKDEELETLSKNCPFLKALDVTCCDLITDAGLENLVCAYMQRLRLRDCKQIGYAGLVSLTKNCPLLYYLDLSFCEQFTQYNLNDVVDQFQYLALLVEPADVIRRLKQDYEEEEIGGIAVHEEEEMSD